MNHQPQDQTRWDVISAHAVEAARRQSWRTYGQTVAEIWREITPAHVVDRLEFDFRYTSDPAEDMRQNSQTVRRNLVGGVIKNPCRDLEDALILAMPEDIRDRCESELAARRGRLAPLLPRPEQSPHTAEVESIGAVMKECGELVTAHAEALADGHLSPDEIARLRGEARDVATAAARVVAACDAIARTAKTVRFDLSRRSG